MNTLSLGRFCGKGPVFSILFLLVLVTSLWGSEPLVFEDEAQAERFRLLTVELRCLVCQNQTLADSDAPLANDLRLEIFKMLQAGQSDEEIKTFLVDRYGDFVLYRPPLDGNTLFLWFMPGLLLVAGGLLLVNRIRKQASLEGPEGDRDG